MTILQDEEEVGVCASVYIFMRVSLFFVYMHMYIHVYIHVCVYM